MDSQILVKLLSLDYWRSADQCESLVKTEFTDLVQPVPLYQ